MHVFVCWEPGTKCSPRNFSFGIVPVWLFIWLQLKKFGSGPVWFYSMNVLFGLCFSSLLSSNDECDCELIVGFQVSLLPCLLIYFTLTFFQNKVHTKIFVTDTRMNWRKRIRRNLYACWITRNTIWYFGPIIL